MAKRPGSRSSRSERRAGKQRAQRAREHGLPERRPEPVRARSETPEPRGAEGEGRSSDAPPAPPLRRRVPTLVWVVGGALAILAGAYVLSQMRDGALIEPIADPEPAASVPGEREPSPVEAAATADAQAPTAAPPQLASSAPVVAASAIVAPSRPKVGKPVTPIAKPPTAVTAAPAAKPEPPPAVPAPLAPATPAEAERPAPAPVGTAGE